MELPKTKNVPYCKINMGQIQKDNSVSGIKYLNSRHQIKGWYLRYIKYSLRLNSQI